MPFAICSLLMEKMALLAPRILNEPVFWKLSHLKNRRAPAMASSSREVSTGVRWMVGAVRGGAATIVGQSGTTNLCSSEEPVLLMWSLLASAQPILRIAVACRAGIIPYQKFRITGHFGAPA